MLKIRKGNFCTTSNPYDFVQFDRLQKEILTKQIDIRACTRIPLLTLCVCVPKRKKKKKNFFKKKFKNFDKILSKNHVDFLFFMLSPNTPLYRPPSQHQSHKFSYQYVHTVQKSIVFKLRRDESQSHRYDKLRNNGFLEGKLIFFRIVFENFDVIKKFLKSTKR